MKEPTWKTWTLAGLCILIIFFILYFALRRMNKKYLNELDIEYGSMINNLKKLFLNNDIMRQKKL